MSETIYHYHKRLVDLSDLQIVAADNGLYVRQVFRNYDPLGGLPAPDATNTTRTIYIPYKDFIDEMLINRLKLGGQSEPERKN
jgi:hypothetical protein